MVKNGGNENALKITPRSTWREKITKLKIKIVE